MGNIAARQTSTDPNPMSEPVSERPYPYARLIWPEAVSIVSMVLNVVVVAILIVAFVGRHHENFRGREGFHGPGPMGFGGPAHFEGMRGGDRFDGEHEHGFGGPGQGGDGKFESHEGGGPARFGPINPQEMADHRLDRLSGNYTLTDAQKNQLRPILLQAATDAQKSMEDERKARTTAMEATRAKIRAVLTPDQQKQFDQESQEREHPPMP